MKGCNYIKRMIDEADKADLLPFEVNEHIGNCVNCERFASERTALRGLLATERRVSVPVNFDAMLKARLVEVKGRSAFSWLSAPGFMRLGAATAGLVIMFFAAQYAGLLSNQSKQAVQQPTVAGVPPSSASPVPVSPAPAAPSVNSGSASENTQITAVASNGAGATKHPIYSASFRGGRGLATRGRTAPDGYFTAEDGGVVLVRGHNGEMDVPMPTVSVGAQQLVYVSAGQRSARSTPNSF